MNQKSTQQKTSVDVYLSTVYKWGLFILVCACMCATVMFNTEKLFGLYPTVPGIETATFDFTGFVALFVSYLSVTLSAFQCFMAINRI